VIGQPEIERRSGIINISEELVGILASSTHFDVY
jgi:hypothetical protein